ncbi:hypothetical protein [Variovorax sp. RA8]|uniref:hypothetical protein n=1 Tax=Variovorax sp. (strain JCM 16519 / RA8) TaxID=662548 RepID=UPI000AF80D88|nr:hypothetical protein [Variovorax sp. RA8]VTU34492.1 hypothetical protein RA8CHR_04984 [Variovorax sp. RA8]
MYKSTIIKFLPHSRSKYAVIPVSNVGDVGKSTAMIALIEACMHHQVPVAIFSGDKDHTELLEVYGAKGKTFDIRKDKSSFINALQSPEKVIAIDTPAAFIDVLYDTFEDMDTLLSSFEMFDTMPLFMVPIATDKCLESVKRLAQLLAGVEGEYRIIYMMNEGKMTNKAALLKAFDDCKQAQNELTSGRAVKLRITTKFTAEFQLVVKTQRLRNFIQTPANGMELVLAHDFLRKTDDQFAGVLDFPHIDPRTGLEKGLGVTITPDFKEFGTEGSNKGVNEILMANVPTKKK